MNWFTKYRKARKKHETIASIVEWQEKVFPDARMTKQLEKFLEEEQEFDAAIKRQDKLTELADMFIVACNVSRFNSIVAGGLFCLVHIKAEKHKFSSHKLQKAVDDKMAINRRRQWNSLGGKYQHKVS